MSFVEHTGGGGGGRVMHTEYLANFIRDTEKRREAVEGGNTLGASPVCSGSEQAAASPHVPPEPGATPQEKPFVPVSGMKLRYPIPVLKVAPGACMMSDKEYAYRGALARKDDVPYHAHEGAATVESTSPTQNRPSHGINPTHPTATPSSSTLRGDHTGSATLHLDSRSYIDVDDIPMQLPTTVRRERPWHYSVCHCCNSYDACLEAWCCLPCQISRQCNMFLNDKPKIHWPICLFISCFETSTACMFVACIFVGQTRRMARQRYGIGGSGIEDCYCSWWCKPCVVQQLLLEMTVMNDFPGASCYTVEPFVGPQSGDVEML